jgi:DNA-binding CsgD family transcriptional regulator
MPQRCRSSWPPTAEGFARRALRNPMGQPLTDRQREIIELVAAGLSNKEIAERLVTSVRTVEGHLYHAYQRLGARSPEQLVEILRARQGGS